MTDWTREKIVEAVKEAAQRYNGELSMREFARSIGVQRRLIYRIFPIGGWAELRELAGLRRHSNDRDPYTDDYLLGEFHRVVAELGKIPSWDRFASMASVAPLTVARRFGGQQGTLERYWSWLVENHPGSPLLDLVRAKLLTMSAGKIASAAPSTTG